ncbi:MAG: helix-turn-helix transcriptional regulator [Erysipelotrichaceae bacterium]|nr:helix-turn-helix transcriptional regulator [Erysipelotrichaceae bacterium]
MTDTMSKNALDFYYSKVSGITNNESAPHFHHALEIYYLQEGVCSYFMGNRFYQIHPGDLVLIPEGTIHSTKYNNSQHSRVVVNCSSEYIPESVLERLPSIEMIYRNSTLIPLFDKLFAKIEKEVTEPDKLSQDLLKCYTAELLLMVVRNKNEYAVRKEENNLIPEAIRYLQQNYMNEVKLSAVAKLLLVSPEHLSRTFKKEMGIGFNEYLTIFRLQKAEFMLRSCPNKPISEIAYVCGFNDGNYFSYKFKEAYGYSPMKIKGKKYDQAPRKGLGSE